jgi:hypothetical protein
MITLMVANPNMGILMQSFSCTTLGVKFNEASSEILQPNRACDSIVHEIPFMMWIFQPRFKRCPPRVV